MRRALLLSFLALALGCAPQPDFKPAALSFTKALAAREFDKAHALMTAEARRGTTPEALRRDFERMIPKEFGNIGAIEVGKTMTSWPDKRAADLGWAYVGIGGTAYSEAIIVVVALEDGLSKIRQAEFGRP